jgi:hypothetical protein
MKSTIKLISILLIVSACFQNSDREIDFESLNFKNSKDLQRFILSNPNSEHLLVVLDSLKELRKGEYFNSDYVERGYHNRYRILLNNNGQLLFNGNVTNFDNLCKDITYIYNEEFDPELSELVEIKYDDSKSVYISKGIMTLKSGNNIQQKEYAETISLINSCLYSLKDSLSISLFNKNYRELDGAKIKFVDEIIDSRFILEEYYELKVPDPYPDSLRKIEVIESELIEEI